MVRYVRVVTIRASVLAFAFAFAAALALSACGGESEGTSAPADATTSEAASDAGTETTEGVATDETAADPAEDDGGTEAEGGCDKSLTPAEVESILGVPVEISGTGQICIVHFADDSIGNLQVFSGSKADEAMDALLTQFESDSTASADGVLLADGRGHVLDRRAIVRGGSGQVFRFDTPDYVEVADVQAAMEVIPALLLTR